MKFPRNARIFRGQLDAAPFVSVFFLLVIFVLLGSMTYTPGVRIELPKGAALSGVEGPALAVAVDATGRFYFKNRLTDATNLVSRLQAAVRDFPESPALIVHADRNTRRESLDELASIAQQAGIRELLLAAASEP